MVSMAPRYAHQVRKSRWHMSHRPAADDTPGGTPLCPPRPHPPTAAPPPHPTPSYINRAFSPARTPNRYNTLMAARDVLLFDQARQALYLTAISQGQSESAACRTANITWPALQNLLRKDPDFARRESQARQAAQHRVEDSLYYLATGDFTPAEAEFHAQERARKESNGVPPEEIPLPTPHRPDRQAATTWLERRAPARWAPPSSNTNATHVHAHLNLSATDPDSIRQFQEELLSRQQALNANNPALPGESGAVYAAQVVSESDPTESDEEDDYDQQEDQ